MELVHYWRVIRRRWWLVASLVLVVGLLSAIRYDWSPDATYACTFRFNVGLAPVAPSGAEYQYDPLGVWTASEYLMDDLASAVRGRAFAERVAERVTEQMGIDGASLAGRFGAATEHRVLTVSVGWGDAAQLGEIANAAVAVLQQEGAQFVGAAGSAQPVLRLIDPPTISPVGRSLRQKLDLPIRLGLAVVTGVAGAFLLDYLDASVRDQEEVEALGIQVLAQIPRHR
jgi:capsular polysaccharide biosynthesis protein